MADFATTRSLYNKQDLVTRLLAHRVIDGGLRQVRARRSFAHEKDCQVQFLVQREDSFVRQEYFQIPQENGYSLQS